jgi:probable phosphoglycerate mutase
MHEKEIEKVVYFVRHGQSEDNVLPVFQSADPCLSDEGKRQAFRLADRAVNLDFEALLTSPYPRARETAEIIGQATGKVPEEVPLFIERQKPAELNGKLYADKEANKLYLDWHASFHNPDLRVGDGENYEDLIARIDAGLQLLRTRPERSLVVVTHGYFLRSIVARVILGQSLTPALFKQFQNVLVMQNTGLTVLRYQAIFQEEPAWRLWIYNDQAHLAE